MSRIRVSGSAAMHTSTRAWLVRNTHSRRAASSGGGSMRLDTVGLGGEARPAVGEGGRPTRASGSPCRDLNGAAPGAGAGGWRGANNDVLTDPRRRFQTILVYALPLPCLDELGRV